MSILFRNYTKQPGITEDYHKVREFFIKLGHAEFEYTRWDWMTTHYSLDKSAVGKIGLWEDEKKVVGVATFDTRPGEAFCLTLPGYEYLKKEMLIYAKDNLSKDGEFSIIIRDIDLEFQDIAAELGFVATQDKEFDSFFYLDKTSVEYEMPEGFYITTMKDTFDLYQYRRVLWRGFNHELEGDGELKFSEEEEQEARKSMIRINVDLDLKIAVIAPDGNFVSYCGMWYDKDAGFAVVEPVATDPDYRKMGLGKAAVLEGIRRVRELGAKKVIVGSQQQFYYSIGFRPFLMATLWKEKR